MLEMVKMLECVHCFLWGVDCVKSLFFKNNSISSVLPFSSTCGGLQLHRQAFNASPKRPPIQLSSSAAQDCGNCHLQLIACFSAQPPPPPL